MGKDASTEVVRVKFSSELGDQFYREAIEQCRSYNARLCAERSVRLPFLDSQTGVAQNNCYIWMERQHRGPGLAAGQMYTYPARCWRKKRRLHTSVDSSLHLYGLNIAKDPLPTPSTALEALLRGDGLDKRNNTRDEESLLEIQRVLEADANEDGYHDDEDFEVDVPKRKHRGKGRGRGSGRRRADVDDDKPYIYENRYNQKQNSKPAPPVYGKRYRNRTGLSYHYDHSHITDKEEPQVRDSEPSRSPVVNHRPHSRKRGRDEAKEEKPFAGTEELFGATSESDASTFHGFEEDELEEPLSNNSDASLKCR